MRESEKEMETTIEFRVQGLGGHCKRNENYYNGLHRDYYEDPFLPYRLTQGQLVYKFLGSSSETFAL